MPGKEAVVEVEKAVVPEPVTKEIPKLEGASVDVKSKKDEEPEPVKPTETASAADSAESKPQDTEITSSAEQKTEKKDISSDKADAEAAVESTNGSSAKSDKKGTGSQAKESSAANGGTKPEESSAKPKVDAVEEPKSSEAAPKVESEVEAKSSEAEAKPAETPIDAKSSEAEVAESKADPMDTNVKTSDTKPEETVVSETKSSEATPAKKVEAMEVDSKSSEAAAKPLPADNEKITIEKDSKSASPVVTGSDEAKKPEAPQETKDNGSSSVDSSTEKTPASSETKTEEKPGSSSTKEVQHDLETQMSELKKQGLALYVRKDYCAAADKFGKVLEVQAPLYGELSEKLAETYFLYGSAMYEYGKTESGVLGEKVKEKDDEDEDDEEGEGEGEEQMEVDDKEAEPAAEDPAEKRPTTPSGYGDAEDMEGDKEPADVTITGDDKEDDDDAFRVAWEMLELAKATFLKADNKKRLADTLVKLGEVGIEIENENAMTEMEEGLKIRKEVFPANHRIIPETHFNIGIAYAAFDKYDDAIQHFTSAKDCLEKRIEELSKSETKEDKAEVEEMKSLLPEIQEKINDTKESKADKEKLKEKIEGQLLKEAQATPFPAPSEDKPVSNISHLVKRKRKVDEILPERAAKQSRHEGDADAASTTEETKVSESLKPADSMEVVETESKKKATVEESKVEEMKPDTESAEKPDTKSEEKLDPKSEEKLDPKSEEKPDTKSEEKPDSKSEEKPDPKSEEKPDPKSEEKPDPKSEEKPKGKPKSKTEETPEGVKDVMPSEEKKPEEGTEKSADPAKPEEAKPAETAAAKSSEPEKMEE